MELFAHLQIAQAYEQSDDRDLADLDFADLDFADLVDRFNQFNFFTLALTLGQTGLKLLLALTAGWSTLLSGTALAIEDYNPGFRADGSEAAFVPIAPAATSTVPVNCANALCRAACGDNNNGGGSNVTVVPPIQRPIINVSDNTFVAVRPSQPAGIFLRRGDVGPQIVQLQELLRAAGYFDAAATGFFASLTETGVRAFQRDRGLDVDGIVGEETFAALQGFRPVRPVPLPQPIPQPIVRLQIGDRGPDVVRLQVALLNVGFYRGPVDGVYAATTEQAVIAFQQATGLPVSGIADSLTLARLGLTDDRVAAR